MALHSPDRAWLVDRLPRLNGTQLRKLVEEHEKLNPSTSADSESDDELLEHLMEDLEPRLAPLMLPTAVPLQYDGSSAERAPGASRISFPSTPYALEAGWVAEPSRLVVLGVEETDLLEEQLLANSELMRIPWDISGGADASLNTDLADDCLSSEDSDNFEQEVAGVEDGERQLIEYFHERNRMAQMIRDHSVDEIIGVSEEVTDLVEELELTSDDDGTDPAEGNTEEEDGVDARSNDLEGTLMEVDERLASAELGLQLAMVLLELLPTSVESNVLDTVLVHDDLRCDLEPPFGENDVQDDLENEGARAILRSNANAL